MLGRYGRDGILTTWLAFRCAVLGVQYFKKVSPLCGRPWLALATRLT